MPKHEMTEPEDSYYRVRVVLPGGTIYLGSRDAPHQLPSSVNWIADWIADEREKGDTIGFIEWRQVVAITWRWSGPPGSEPSRTSTQKERNQ